MGIDSRRFTGDQYESFKCPVCLDVLEDPVTIDPCDHVFCKSCLVVGTCPLCRVTVTRTKPINRILKEVYEKLPLKCSFDDCNQQVTVGNYITHESECRRGKSPTCGFLELDSNGVQYLIDRNLALEMENSQLKTKNSKLVMENSRLVTENRALKVQAEIPGQKLVQKHVNVPIVVPLLNLNPGTSTVPVTERCRESFHPGSTRVLCSRCGWICNSCSKNCRGHGGTRDANSLERGEHGSCQCECRTNQFDACSSNTNRINLSMCQVSGRFDYYN